MHLCQPLRESSAGCQGPGLWVCGGGCCSGEPALAQQWARGAADIPPCCLCVAVSQGPMDPCGAVWVLPQGAALFGDLPRTRWQTGAVAPGVEEAVLSPACPLALPSWRCPMLPCLPWLWLC